MEHMFIQYLCSYVFRLLSSWEKLDLMQSLHFSDMAIFEWKVSFKGNMMAAQVLYGVGTPH